MVAFGVSHEQQAVAQRIRPAREATAKPIAVSRCAAASSRRSPRTPRSRHTQWDKVEGQHVQARVQEHLAAGTRRASARSRNGFSVARSAAVKSGIASGAARPDAAADSRLRCSRLRKRVQLLRPVDRSLPRRSRAQSRRRSAARVRWFRSSTRNRNSSLRREPPIVRVRKNRRQRRLEPSGIDDDVQVDGLNAGARALRLLEDADAADIGQRDGQERDAGRDGQRQPGRLKSLRTVLSSSLRSLNVPLGSGRVGQAHRMNRLDIDGSIGDRSARVVSVSGETG